MEKYAVLMSGMARCQQAAREQKAMDEMDDDAVLASVLERHKQGEKQRQA